MSQVPYSNLGSGHRLQRCVYTRPESGTWNNTQTNMEPSDDVDSMDDIVVLKLQIKWKTDATN